MSREISRRQFLKKTFKIGIGAVIAASGVRLKYENDVLEDEIEKLQQEQVNIQDTQEQIEETARENLLGDCVNENILRESLGAPPTSLEGCIYERKEWLENLRKSAQPDGSDL